jgi:hypothetical protein
MTANGHSSLSLDLPGYLYVTVNLAEVDATEVIYAFTNTLELRGIIESTRPGLTEHMPTSRIAFLTILAWLATASKVKA